MALGLIVLVGAALRLYDLDRHTITHVEMYVPGIDLPENHSEPDRRFTLTDVFVSMADSQEPHPPAYYVAMLGWTKLFGTSVAAMRLPSALLGIGSILLVYLLAAQERDQSTALLAAAILALHGHHIYWSQIAKMYGPGVFLGLLSTVVLLRLTRRAAHQRPLLWMYAGATLVGLATTVYAWPIFVTHVLWTSHLAWARTASVRGLLRLQALTFAVATPLCALAAFQSRRPSYLARNPLTDLLEFFQFGFLFEPDGFSPPPLASPWLSIAVVAFAMLLLAYGLRASRQPSPDAFPVTGPSLGWISLASVTSLISIAWFGIYANGVAPQVTGRVIATGALPMLAVLGAALTGRLGIGRGPGTTLAPARAWCRDRMSLGSVLAVLPIALVAAVSLVIPVLASRAALLWTPYLIVVLAGGAVALIRRARPWIVILPALAMGLAMGLNHYRDNFSTFTVDYKALSQKWIPQVKDSDLIFIREHFLTTPIFYYLKGDRFHFIGGDYAAEIHNHPGARVWVLTFPNVPVSGEIEAALKGSGYAPLEALDDRQIRVTLFTELWRAE